jgi:two-component system chemotaxis response regulator CheB
LFGSLPGDLPVPIVLVQHMPPMFTRLLAERLSARSAVRVEEGRAGAPLRPGHCWVAPGDHHMTLARDGIQVKLVLNQDPPENSCRPAADVLFRSVAQAFGPAALAVVLTGMGRDGLRGSEAVRAAGGDVIAQDEATSVVWGMPGAVARAGLADALLPLAAIAPEVVRRVAAGRGGGR